MTQQPKYDFTLIGLFSGVAALSLWAIFWNTVIFNMSLDIAGAALLLIGLANLGTVIYYTWGVWKLRRNFVWETLKNG